MRYTIEQKGFFKANYNVIDEYNNIAFYVDSNDNLFKADRFIYDRYQQQVAYLVQKSKGLQTFFEIYRDEILIARIVRKGSIFKNELMIENSDLDIIGNFWSTNYDLINNEGIIASISSSGLSFKNVFQVNMDEQFEPIIGVSIALAIDIMNKQAAAAA